jgi:hypothetical protein
MAMRSFTSGEPDVKPSAEFDVPLDGEKFHCTIQMDADSLLEWSEMAAAASDDNVDMESAAGVAYTARFFRLVMSGPGVYARFRLHLKQHHTSQETLMEIMQAINEEVQTSVEQAAERPTRPPSRSSSGRAATGGRTTVRQQRRKAS